MERSGRIRGGGDRASGPGNGVGARHRRFLRLHYAPDVSTSDPPVDPRTESDPSRNAARPRPRSAIRENWADDAQVNPTVQVPVAPMRDPSWDVEPPSTIVQPVVPGPYSSPPGQAQYAEPYGTDPSYADYGYDPNAYPPDGYGIPQMMVPAPGFAQGRPRVRKVSRVVRAIDTWSVFKISLIFYFAMYVICLVAGVLLWNVAYSTGTIDNISSFFESFGWKSFEFKGGEIYHNAWIVGLLLVVGLTGMNVVLATLYNLISDLVGGVRVTVLEEEVLLRRPAGTGDDRVGDGPVEGGVSPVDPARSPMTRWRRRRRVLR